MAYLWCGVQCTNGTVKRETDGARGQYRYRLFGHLKRGAMRVDEAKGSKVGWRGLCGRMNILAFVAVIKNLRSFSGSHCYGPVEDTVRNERLLRIEVLVEHRPNDGI